MDRGLSDMAEEEPLLSKNTKRLLAKAGIRTFRGLARMKTGTFLKRVPKITVRALYSIEECLDYRKLSFVEDGTISSFKDPSIPQRKLSVLWSKGIVKYKDFNKFHYWGILEILGWNTFKARGLYPWIKRKGIVLSTSYPLFGAGFTEKTLDILMSNEIDTFEKITSMTEFDLACLFAGYRKKDRWPTYGSWAMAQVIEVKYILWKHKMPCLKFMNQERDSFITLQ